MTPPIEPAPSGNLLCNYLVAFVDLLGQSEKLLEFKHADQMQPESIHFQKWFRETFGTVMFFRKSFFDFIRKVNTKREGSLVPANFTETAVRMIPASDSIVLYTSLYDTNGSRAIQNTNSVVAIFQALGALAPMFIALGTPFRAGLTIGLGLEAEEIGFYGSALPLAVELEKQADYPRIVVDPYVIEFLDGFSMSEPVSLTDKYLNAQASEARAMLFRDQDEIWAIDFLGVPIKKLYDMSNLPEIDPFNDGYKRIQDSIVSAKKLKIKSKYFLLKEYYDSRASIWLKNGAHP